MRRRRRYEVFTIRVDESLRRVLEEEAERRATRWTPKPKPREVARKLLEEARDRSRTTDREQLPRDLERGTTEAGTGDVPDGSTGATAAADPMEERP